MVGTMRMLPHPATLQAQSMHADWLLFLWTGLFVAAVVYCLIIWPLIVSRRRTPDHWPPQFRRNAPLEITYTVIPLLIVVVLFSFSYRYETNVDRIAAHPDLIVNVTGFRWSWQFEYPSAGVRYAGTPLTPPELVLPLEKTTRINLMSADVNHAFWIPGFLFKRDAIPGIVNHFDLHPTKSGEFLGRCAVFCGLDHALMTFTVRVVNPQTFRSWLAGQRRIALAIRRHS